MNRWLKYSREFNYFYHADKDALYKLKFRLILDWVQTGLVKPTKVVVRTNDLFDKIDKLLASSSSKDNIECYDDFFLEDYLNEEELSYLETIRDLTNQKYSIPYPEDVQQKRREEYQRNLGTFKEYQQRIEEYNKREKKAAYDWAVENNIHIPRTNSKKNYKKDWVKRLRKKGFVYNEPKPRKVDPPQKPQTHYHISFDTYIPYSEEKVEKAIAWGLKECPEFKDYPYNTLGDEFLEAIENKKFDEILDIAKEEFVEVLENIDKTPVGQTWESLREFHDRIDIGMTLEEDIFFDLHWDVNQFKEVKLSRSGFWLVEFVSNVEGEDISYHIPYDDCPEHLKNGLPKEDLDQVNFGYPISEEDKKRYPIEVVVRYLGMNPFDFPHNLEQFISKKRFFNPSDEFDEFDDKLLG